MAAHVYGWIFLCCTFAADGLRYGSQSDTIHVSADLRDTELKNSPRVVAYKEWSDDARSEDSTDSRDTRGLDRAVAEETTHQGHTVHRLRRQAPAAGTIVKSVVNLNDSHYQLVIHWAGEGSDVIVALSRDISPTPASTSHVYISRDYGKTFSVKKLPLNATTDGIIDIYYNSPVYNSHYIFVDVIHNVIWTTLDSGMNVQLYRLSFTPRQLMMHPTNWRIVAGYDERDPEKRLWLSRDFGATWQVLHTGVKAFYWGVVPYDNASTIYLQTEVPSVVLRYTGSVTYSAQELFRDVKDFEVVDRFMFVTRNVSLLGSRSLYHLQLWISQNRGSFQHASFPNNDVHQDFFIADATESQVFLCANHNSSSTNLYISDATGLRYSLSLSNIVYFNPRGSNKDSWLKNVINRPFADIHKVNGLDGVYIATQMLSIADLSPFNDYNQVSVITFNKGGYWHPIPAPDTDVKGNKHCNTSNYQQVANCSLHLAQRFQSLFYFSRVSPILSKKSAVGLLLATGNVGAAIVGRQYNVYMSNDGGLVWKEILEGAHYYAMGDHGGLIVTIRLTEMTGDILYSFDEGESWFSFTFSDVKLRIYGLLTEPGEKTTVFSVFGSLANGSHSWVVVQVNLTAVLGKPCKDEDYKQWSPTDSPKVDCLLGRKTVYERRRPHSLCFNGRDYEREISVENCPCSVQDYECDVGFREISFPATSCVYDVESGINVYRPPSYCPEGSLYNRTKGYRRVVGDVCEGGLAEVYEAEVLPCPIQGQEEFLLFTNHTSIHRYVFDHQRHEILPVGDLGNVLTVEYDYHNDCLFWSDARLSNIQMLCLRGENVTRKVIVSENLDVIEGLAYNWMSHQLFWVDAGHQRIEVVRVDGTHRKVLINSTLNSPRAIIVSPSTGYMFWTDWSSTNPRISRSYMDGSNIQPILTGTNQVHWPNGLAIDEAASLLYITDAYLDWIGHCKLDGSEFKVIIRNHPLVQHPYSLGIFKEEIYWTDWTVKAVLKANKVTGRGVQKVISDIPGILDLKVLHRISQRGQSACSTNNGQCQSLCFEKPPQVGTLAGSNRTCHCSDMYIESTTNSGTQCLCADGKVIPSSGICSTSGPNSTCAFHQFTCSNGHCIPIIFKCDGDNDCGDMSDEIHCLSVTCLPSQFQCRSGRCIPGSWKCDHDNDCGDMSDEPTHCTFASCSADQFQCDNGRCVAKRWVCDRDDDCHDGSDERNCTGTRHVSCATREFQCITTGICIPKGWMCDGDRDCSDGSDELTGCQNRTRTCAIDEYRCNDGSCIPLRWKCDGTINCDEGEDEQSCPGNTSSPWPTGRPGHCLAQEFECLSGNWCIAFRQVCDGIQDCLDNSDERLCHSCTRPNQFQCRNGRCISRYMVCDANDDCGDSSDEMDCVPYSTTPSGGHCADHFYSCEGGGCVYESWVCDGEPDCVRGDDENNCQNATNRCHPLYFSCILTTGCIPASFVCDHEPDCLDGSDEIDCDNHTQWSNPPHPVSCPPSLFSCDYGDCIKWKFRCDGHWDCPDGADERECDTQGYRAVFFLPKSGTAADQITVRVQNIVPNITANSTVELHCMLSDSDVIRMKNVTVAPFPFNITFGNLSADTEYEVGVIVVVSGHEYPMSPVMTTKTLPLAPSPPQNVNGVVQVADNQLILNISWTKPAQPNGRLVGYRIKCEDLTGEDGIQQISAQVPASATSYIFTTAELMLGHKYHVQVAASNGKESSFSFPPLNVSFAPKTGCVNVLSTDAGSFIDGEFVNLEAHTAHEGYGKSIIVSWHYAGETPNDVLFYRIFLGAKDVLDNLTLSERASDVRCNTESHKKCSAQVNNLNPATEYVVEVAAQGKDRSFDMCTVSQPIVIRTPGNRPNPPTISISPRTNGTVVLNYTFDTNVELQDGLMRVFYESLHGNSNNNEMDLNSASSASSRFSPADHAKGRLMEINNLTACSFYCFMAQIQWPARSGLSQSVCILTSYDELAPPRDLLIKEVNHNQQFVNVSLFWSPPCRPTAMEYVVEVSEEGRSSISNLVKDSGGYTITTPITDLKRGATYDFSVRRNIRNARSTPVVSKTMRMYPSPRQFKVISELYEDNMKLLFILTWEPPAELPNNQTIVYDVYHSNNYEKDQLKAIFSFYKSTSDLKFLIYDDTLVPSEDHTFQVRVQSILGYPGEFTQPETVYALSPAKLSGLKPKKDDSGASSMVLSKESTLIVSLLVPAAIIVLALAILLSVYVVRHRRLQNSLLSYTSSRYDCRSNSATFNDLAEEDQPMIQCFSDDEPLIVA